MSIKPFAGKHCYFRKQKIPECEQQRNYINEYIDLKHPNEKQTKMIENFDEKIPEDANIWRQVSHIQSKT